MTTADAATASAFSESVALLLQLHDLMSRGQGESREAYELRADMERPWHAMNDHERTLVEDLSADLFSLGQDRTSAPADTTGVVSAIEGAARRGEYRRALDVLRENEGSLSPDYVGHWRGVCWADLGQLAVARLFFGEAIRVAPDNLHYKAMLLRSLILDTPSDHEISVARTYVDVADDPLLLYLGACAVFNHARSLDEPSRLEGFRAVIDLVERANRAVNDNPPAMIREYAEAANLWRGICHDQLEEPEMARSACEFVLGINPNNPHAQKLRGLLTSGVTPQTPSDRAAPLPLPQSLFVEMALNLPPGTAHSI
jgi:tetratricopeptide (TPR) repeat protein